MSEDLAERLAKRLALETLYDYATARRLAAEWAHLAPDLWATEERAEEVLFQCIAQGVSPLVLAHRWRATIDPPAISLISR